jgi:predicted MFS family arabinose efflux permease
MVPVAFFAPAQSVSLRVLVKKEDLLTANALFSQAFYIVRIVSPAIAGALVAWLGENVCFWFDAASFAFSAAMIWTLTIARAAPQPHESAKSMWHSFLEGNRFIFTHKELSFAFLSSCAAMFVLSSFSPLISVYIRDILRAGPMVYGGISAMVGVGLMIGTFAVRGVAARRPIEELVVGGLFGLGLGASLLGAFHFSATAALSTFLLGSAIAFVVVPAQTISQKETPHEMQGRVSSTFIAMFSFAQIAGMLLSGVLADKLGIERLFLAAGATVLVFAAAGFFLLRPRAQVGPAS